MQGACLYRSGALPLRTQVSATTFIHRGLIDPSLGICCEKNTESLCFLLWSGVLWCWPIYLHVFEYVPSWANYFALSWLPKYLHEEVGVSLDQTGFVLILPYIAPVAGGNIGAQIADRLLQRGWSVVSVRRTMECICKTHRSLLCSWMPTLSLST